MVRATEDDRDVEALARRLQSERARRLAAEEIAESSTRRLYALVQELERSNADLERFAHIASHDLQEPLRTVALHLQLIERRLAGQRDAALQESLDFAIDGSQRMHQLIEGLLAYSRARRHEPPSEPASLQDAWDEAVAGLQGQIEQTGAVVRAGGLPDVPVHTAQLAVLCHNLVGNALKFRGGEAPRVRLTCEDAGLDWRFAVTDNGIGVDPAYADQVFDLFRRLHKRPEYPGTGLGLALCKSIVERAGGRIGIESDGKTGTTVWFTLPKLRDDPRRGEEAAP